MDVIEAKKALEEERTERQKRALQRISDILSEEKCAFDFAITITQRGDIVPNMRVVANE